MFLQMSSTSLSLMTAGFLVHMHNFAEVFTPCLRYYHASHNTVCKLKISAASNW